MLPPDRSPSMESNADNNIRKRVCKACDRCRLKKSKCDGANPCSRCKADNAICVFGERKKSHDKVYPKGYVEMLEQQQAQLVAGLCELYRRLNTGDGWPGSPLVEQQGGRPLTHDILQRLGILQPKDGTGLYDQFEEDPSRLEKRLREEEEAAGAPANKRRGSVASTSDHGHVSSPSSHGTPPTPSKPLDFSEPYRTAALPSIPSTFQGIQQQQQQQFPLSSSVTKSFSGRFDGTISNPAPMDIMSQYAIETPQIGDLPPYGYSAPFETEDYSSFMANWAPTGFDENSINPDALQDYPQFS